MCITLVLLRKNWFHFVFRNRKNLLNRCEFCESNEKRFSCKKVRKNRLKKIKKTNQLFFPIGAINLKSAFNKNKTRERERVKLLKYFFIVNSLTERKKKICNVLLSWLLENHSFLFISDFSFPLVMNPIPVSSNVTGLPSNVFIISKKSSLCIFVICLETRFSVWVSSIFLSFHLELISSSFCLFSLFHSTSFNYINPYLSYSVYSFLYLMPFALFLSFYKSLCIFFLFSYQPLFIFFIFLSFSVFHSTSFHYINLCESFPLFLSTSFHFLYLSVFFLFFFPPRFIISISVCLFPLFLSNSTSFSLSFCLLSLSLFLSTSFHFINLYGSFSSVPINLNLFSLSFCLFSLFLSLSIPFLSQTFAFKHPLTWSASQWQRDSL